MPADFVVGCFVQIALGTVTNVDEAVRWLSYTYLYVRMRANPLAYGISHQAYQVLMLSEPVVNIISDLISHQPVIQIFIVNIFIVKYLAKR